MLERRLNSIRRGRDSFRSRPSDRRNWASARISRGRSPGIRVTRATPCALFFLFRRRRCLNSHIVYRPPGYRDPAAAAAPTVPSPPPRRQPLPPSFRHPDKPLEEKPTSKPVLQKPPGYRDPAAAAAPTVPRPPPRRQPLPPSFRHPDKPLPRHRRPRRSYCCRICCWASAVALVAAALFAVATALAYLWFQPHLPSFRLAYLNATHLRVAARPDGTFLDMVTHVGILATNPNGRLVLEYGDGEARMAVGDDDGDVGVGTAAIAGFEQGRRNRTVVRFSAAVKGVAVDEVAGARIRAGFRSKEVRFLVEVRTRLGVGVGGTNTGKVPIRVGCGPVTLKQGVSGGTLPKCRFYFLRWINLR
ncbi:hypothetical protein OPV22_022674 [Ensete ventricosum]|uniref:Late embryogenesis abundant protein LEA-2 subgroup domain-containing protein n=1 Tax=Ensete ventricosum TaxID=4639 RepID=A0AAV8QK38_ENSVE|nr:hypothetical protein OPV22_022674 [Ensete ventricosum]